MPPKTRDRSWRELRLGILVCVVVAGGIVTVLLLGTTRGPFMPDTYSLYLDLEDAAGVRVGSFVRVGGMAAGEVANLEIVPRIEPGSPIVGDSLLPPSPSSIAPRDIRLELAIQDPFQPYITPSSRAQLASIGLGGERYVKITAGDVREPPLPPGSTIEEIPSVDWDLIIAKMARALAEAQVLAQQMEEIRLKSLAGGGTVGRLLSVESELYASLDGLADESVALLDLLDEGAGLIPNYRSDPALRDQIDRLRNDLAAIDSLAGGRGPGGAWTDPVELSQALADLRADTEGLNDRLEDGRGSLGRFMNDEELFLQIRVLQARIASLVEAFRADPLGFVNIEIF